jgi:hypothetical protein
VLLLGHIVETMGIEVIVGTITQYQINATMTLMTLGTIVAFDAIVKFVIPFEKE